MLLNNIFLMCSALLAVTSREAESFEMIIISRFLVGINAGNDPLTSVDVNVITLSIHYPVLPPFNPIWVRGAIHTW